MAKLIVTEKNITARRIAQILSEGGVTEGKVSTVPTYTFNQNGNEVVSIGLKGHILKVDFPAEYANWQAVDPAALVDAVIEKVPTQKSFVNAIQKLGKKAEEVIIATDFDREGELIGMDAANLIRDVNPEAPIKRARFSSLTDKEVRDSFGELQELYADLASAGEARQDIDLIWGAALTRFISLASTRLGRNFLSVGRVQTPTLNLIAERERERAAFVSRPYWEISAVFKDGEEFTATHKKTRFWEQAEADAVMAKLADAKTGVVTEVRTSRRKSAPPAPFNTTAFVVAASSLGYTAAGAMHVAETLYMNGLVSYPRVDNTVYPDSMDLRATLGAIGGPLAGLAHELMAKPQLTPTRGKKFATDHPPIHPTGPADPDKLDQREWKIYELISRRFMATLADEAIQESTRVDIEAAGEPFYVRGTVVIDEGWLKYYPYSRKRDEEVPRLAKGHELTLVMPLIEQKETQPPSRYSQSKLIQEMEKLGLGTKATRHEIIKHLYDRGYIHSDPITPTEMAMAVAGALSKYADRIASPEMTAELERDMDAISVGKSARKEVVDHSRSMLANVMLALKSKQTEVGTEIREGIREDQMLGGCPNCEKDLRIIRAKKSKKRFVGCTGYPDCTTTYPLPQFGEIVALGEKCDECGTPRIKVLSARPWTLCLDPSCPSKERERAEREARGVARRPAGARKAGARKTGTRKAGTRKAKK